MKTVAFCSLLCLSSGSVLGCASTDPPPIGEPNPPEMASQAVASEEVAPEEEEAPPLPPPPELSDGMSLEDLEKAPTFTPYTTRPDIKNRSEVAQALRREYPPLLRDAGIGGTAQVWFFLDADGAVRKTQINESSGHQALDQAALRVAMVVEFTPALKEEEPVPVWISLPITFTTR